MSKQTVRNQLLLNDGTGKSLPIQTGSFATSAINIDEHRRLSFTIGIDSATGPLGAGGGGYTGVLQIQGTDELAQCYGQTGTQDAGFQARPGTNGYTGALYWQALPSGTYNITNATNKLLISLTDVGPAFVRVVFNQTATGPSPLSAGANLGSGTISIYMTAKNT